MQEQLKNVRQIHSTHFAFAALRADGRVITWGSKDAGGDSSAVEDELRNIRMYHNQLRFSTARWGITQLTPMSALSDHESSVHMSSVCTKRSKRKRSPSVEDEKEERMERKKDLCQMHTCHSLSFYGDILLHIYYIHI